MKPIVTNLKEIRDIFSAEYTIPNYQRPYTWDEDKCEQLWDDIMAFWRDVSDPRNKRNQNEESYFLGTLVLIKNKNKSKSSRNSYSVIDGQQRLISLSLLIKAICKKALGKNELEGCLVQTHPTTGNLSEKPRIESKVLEKDNDAFKNIILDNDGKEHDNEKKKKNSQNRFQKNYKRLAERVDRWLDDGQRDSKRLDELICILLDQVDLLVIECDSQEDALTMFETMNNRGTPLNDADIFKIKLYESAKLEGKEGKFISEWNNLKEHDRLFKIYMHILRSRLELDLKKKPIPPVMALRKFFLKENQDSLKDYKEVMSILQKLNHINQQEWKVPDFIKKWWKILKIFPNEYWQFPLYAFLITNTEKKWDQDGVLNIEDDSELAKQFKELIEWTVRYFFIKGVNHNSIDAIRRTTFKVYHNISHGRSYRDSYSDSLYKYQDPEEFKRNIGKGLFLGKYEKGMVLIGAILNEKQNLEDFFPLFERKTIHIEHILPKKWNDYDGWDNNSYEKNIHRLGNLVPCEKAVNIAASNEFFKRKKGKYSESKVQDVLDLSNRRSDTWLPHELGDRDRKIITRLLKFFLPPDMAMSKPQFKVVS